MESLVVGKRKGGKPKRRRHDNVQEDLRVIDIGLVYGS